MSSFHGLEMAKRALFTQQSALYTTGHNIANANTEGYSRQRVNFEADVAHPAAARNRPGIPGQIGTGVKAGSIQRLRDEFLDLQFRGENSLAGYWEKRADALGRMESLMNELNETGLSSTMDQFWNSLQDLAVNPSNAGARSVVVQRGIALADTFNYYNESLHNIRADLHRELTQTAGRANTILEGIHDLNDRIQNLETNGYIPNDLYDQRDELIDELSKMIDIEVVPNSSNDAALKNAEGVLTVKTNGITLVDGAAGNYNQLFIQTNDSDADIPYVEALQVVNSIDGNGVPGNQVGEDLPLKKEGTLHSLIEAYGYSPQNGDFLEMLHDLNTLQNVLMGEFNRVQQDEEGNYPPFFDIVDGKMVVTDAIQESPHLIRAHEGEVTGDGSNALELAKIFEKELNFGTPDEPVMISVKDYYASMIGDLAVQAEQANRMEENTGVLLTQLESQRQSVMSVSLDEEMTNMIKFQHAYNAAARSMTATDELLDRIINNMGLVGR